MECGSARVFCALCSVQFVCEFEHISMEKMQFRNDTKLVHSKELYTVHSAHWTNGGEIAK